MIQYPGNRISKIHLHQPDFICTASRPAGNSIHSTFSELVAAEYRSVCKNGRIVRFNGERLIVTGNRLLKALQGTQHGTTLVERVDVAGADSQCLVIARQRLIKTRQLLEGEAAILESSDVTGPHQHRLLVTSKRLVESL